VGEVSSCSVYRRINCGSQGGPCDPSTQTHAGGTPASSLLRGYHPLLHPRRRSLRARFPVSSGSPGPAAHPGVPSPALRQAEAVTRCGDQPSVCANRAVRVAERQQAHLPTATQQRELEYDCT